MADPRHYHRLSLPLLQARLSLSDRIMLGKHSWAELMKLATVEDCEPYSVREVFSLANLNVQPSYQE